MNAAPGSRLGPYEILAPLGAGGMGEVFRARDMRLERTVAIKILPPPFDGRTPASLIGAILKDDPPPLATVQPLTPAPLERVVRRCLAKDRWQSARLAAQ
jgi:hypothetical protein